MSAFHLRPMRPDEAPIVAELICTSIRTWYDAAGRPGRFPGGPASCLLFPQVYEALDPGCCVVAEDRATGRLAGSCFYHPRPLHVSLGIMNAHPDYFGQGVARQLLQFVCDAADQQQKPLRLFSSAMNVDSFSLYNRAGFVPRELFQVMAIQVPAEGMPVNCEGASRVRAARIEDVSRIVELERDISGITRETDYRHFIANAAGIWHTSVIENASGSLDGFLVSIAHPGSTMLGPGVMRSAADAAPLILDHLNHLRGRSPACLIPASQGALVQQLYRWGLRNTELSLFQCRGNAQPFRGVAMPTFMPETG